MEPKAGEPGVVSTHPTRLKRQPGACRWGVSAHTHALSHASKALRSETDPHFSHDFSSDDQSVGQYVVLVRSISPVLNSLL
jgi:hypothetical protein